MSFTTFLLAFQKIVGLNGVTAIYKE